MKGTELFVKALQKEGIDYLFTYPGACTIDLLDELYKQDSIQLILPRHEQGLVHAADGYARSTGRVGVCLVTSGPGATNLVTGIATANYDSVPLVCFTGQVATNLIGNDAFQEVDIVGIVRGICKYAVTVRSRKDLGRIIKEAFYIANTGKKGPVLIDLPKDVMLEEYDDSYPKEVNIRGYKPTHGVHIGQLKKAMGMLKAAQKPLFLMGGGVNIAHANKVALELVETSRIPVITTIMGRGAIPTNHELFIGNVGMHGCYAANHAISECDLLFSIGTRFNDRITGKISEFAKHAKIVHVDIDTASISRNILVDIPIVADAKEAMESMVKHMRSCENKEWLAEVAGWKEIKPQENAEEKGITPKKIIECINRLFPSSVVSTDVGQNQMWTTQFLELDGQRQLLTSGGLGTMGYGLPAAMGAALGNPDKPILCISGDGGVQMNIQEMATAVANELPVILCIFNNSYLGMVRQWQKLFYGKRYSATCIRKRKSCESRCEGPGSHCPAYTPDFVKLAESYGAYGMRVVSEEEIEKAFQFAMEHKQMPTILEFIIDSEEMVLPMIPGGGALTQMIMDC